MSSSSSGHDSSHDAARVSAAELVSASRRTSAGDGATTASEDEERDDDDDDDDDENDDDSDDDEDDIKDDNDRNDSISDNKGDTENEGIKTDFSSVPSSNFRRCHGCMKQSLKQNLAFGTKEPPPSLPKIAPRMIGNEELRASLGASQPLEKIRAAQRAWAKHDCESGFPNISMDDVNRGFENGVRGGSFIVRMSPLSHCDLVYCYLCPSK